jgi:hypothetical protein
MENSKGEIPSKCEQSSNTNYNDVLCDIINNIDYAAYNLCDMSESELEGGITESTCPEKSLFIALRELKKLAGA